MNEQVTLLEALKRILHHRKNNEYFAEKLNVPVEDIEWAREELKKQGFLSHRMTKDSHHADPEIQEETEESGEFNKSSFAFDTRNGRAEATFTLPEEVRTLEELIEKCNIDTEVWEITKYVQNYWGNQGSPRWQVKAWMELKKVSEKDFLTQMLENYTSTFTGFKREELLTNNIFTRPTCLLLSLADFHLDKKTIEEKTLPEKVALYDTVVDQLLFKAYRTHLLDEIVYVIGNDFMHVDSYHNTTTNLTPQETMTTWHEAYETGFDMQVRTIKKLKQCCNRLHVVHVPSNHGRTKEYFLAHALEVFFKQDDSIVFDRTADNTKVYTYGDCFIGMHHGDTNMDKLPLYFASKYWKQWGQCKHKEIALADKHHRKEWKFSLSSGETEGVRMFIAPSLSGTDKWHKDKNYDLAVKAGIGRIYDKEWGYCTEFEERI